MRYLIAGLSSLLFVRQLGLVPAPTAPPTQLFRAESARVVGTELHPALDLGDRVVPIQVGPPVGSEWSRIRVVRGRLVSGTLIKGRWAAQCASTLPAESLLAALGSRGETGLRVVAGC